MEKANRRLFDLNGGGNRTSNQTPIPRLIAESFFAYVRTCGRIYGIGHAEFPLNGRTLQTNFGTTMPQICEKRKRGCLLWFCVTNYVGTENLLALD